jgi:cell wall-associated NlpC family hydrolase
MHAIASPRSDNGSHKYSHWAVPYIGLPYELGARGPDSYDCWGVLWTVYQNVFGITLPEYPGITMTTLAYQCGVINREIMNHWEEVQKPFDGAGVAMGMKGAAHHVGIYISADGGKILHASQDAGSVVLNTVNQLRFHGFRMIKFYRHRLWPTLSRLQTH